MYLVIVESPNKVKKIQSFLGGSWKVAASLGHVRDLPNDEMGVTLQEFTPRYVMNERSEKVVENLKALRRKAKHVFLATDPDREGEAIAWHLKSLLNLAEDEYDRIGFNAITSEAIHQAFEKKRRLNMHLVEGQEARRVLDRLVGYTLSPILSQQANQSLSAGRVQSPCLRLVVERERAIEAFQSVEHFGAAVRFNTDDVEWEAQWDTSTVTTQEAPYVVDQSLAEKMAALRQFVVQAVETKERLQAPPAPFTTSSLLQTANTQLKLKPEMTMRLAQQLFEWGAITYHRTDCPNIEPSVVREYRSYATSMGWPLDDTPRVFKTKANAQEAHEAIRPTDMTQLNAGDEPDTQRLYQLIRHRALASQLATARFAVTELTLAPHDSPNAITFRAKGEVLVDQGWHCLREPSDLTADVADPEHSSTVPALVVGTTLTALDGRLITKRTQPPVRFCQASLIKALERYEMGRPSTYANIVQTLFKRAYITETKGQLHPTRLGCEIVDALLNTKLAVMDYDYTRTLEAQIDAIASGQTSYVDVLRDFYDTFMRAIKTAQSQGVLAQQYQCRRCQRPLRRILTQSGRAFWGCTGFSQGCRYVMDDLDGKPVERQHKEGRAVA